MIEEHAGKAKEATRALIAVIKSCEGPYDERIMDPLNDFLSATADFKSYSLPEAKPPCKMVDPENVAELVDLLKNEARVL